MNGRISKMKKIYQYLIIGLLMIGTLGCSSSSKLAEQSLKDFFLALQSGELRVAQDIILQDTHNIKLIYSGSTETDIIKSMFASIKYEVLSVEKDQGNVKFKINVTMCNSEIAVKSALDELTNMGLSGSILTGFQRALAQSPEVLIKNFNNAQQTTKNATITLTEKDGKYYIIADQELYNLIGKDTDMVIKIYNTLNRNNN